MGYELIYTYYERLGDGTYDKDQPKVVKKRVGKADEDVPYDKLASAIMAQLARRDIWVEDVEIFEFTRKKVSFKEVKGGMLIGNKKYCLDQIGCCFEENDQQEQCQNTVAENFNVQTVQNSAPTQPMVKHEPVIERQPLFETPAPAPAPVKPTGQFKNLAPKIKRPIRHEIFQPDPVLTDAEKVKKMPFTVGKSYPIYEESTAGGSIMNGMNYKTVDNNGVERTVNDKYFIPMNTLLMEEEAERKDRGNSPRLSFGEESFDNIPMPTLRRNL